MNFETPLDVLMQGGVHFIVVGGVAMNLQGSAQNTTDLDVVYDRDRDNIRKLVAALRPFSPRVRGIRDRLTFRFDEATIRNGMNFNLTTRLGDIDLLGEISGIGTFEAVSKLSQKIRVGKNSLWVLSLQGLIRTKRAAGRPKDRLVIPELEALAEVEKETDLPHQIG